MIELAAAVRNVIEFLERQQNKKAADAGDVTASAAVRASSGGAAARSAGRGATAEMEEDGIIADAPTGETRREETR